MKRTLLILGVYSLFLTNFVSAQVNSDDAIIAQPSTNEIASPAITINPKSVTIGGVTIDGEIVPCGVSETTLTSTASCFYAWYADSMGSTLLGSSSDLLVSSITSDTTVYYSGAQVLSSAAFALPPQASTFSGSVRGYYFQAPTDLSINKIYVPTTASPGNQSVAILRFNSGPPPNYATVTNDFTTLGLWQNGTTDTIYTCISIQAGEYIGVLGSRADVNSYGAAGFSTTINGSTVPLTRLGMQFNLSTTAPQDVWTEAGGSISRVELFYGDLVPDSLVPINIIAPQSFNGTATVNYCQGDSVMVGGTYYSADTTVNETLLTTAGCDSIVATSIVSAPLFSTSNDLNFCAGDSILVNNVYYYSSGTVIDTLQAMNGCDSIVTSTLSTTALPINTVSQSGIVLTADQMNATYQWIDCVTGLAIPGETGSSFTPTANGEYAVQLTMNGCSDQSACTTISTVNIDELGINFGLAVYPNPAKSELNYTFNGVESLNYTFSDLNGKIVLNGEMKDNSGKIDVSNIASGTYILEVHNMLQNEIIKIVIE